jgi:hypothetical protein
VAAVSIKIAYGMFLRTMRSRVAGERLGVCKRLVLEVSDYDYDNPCSRFTMHSTFLTQLGNQRCLAIFGHIFDP